MTSTITPTTLYFNRNNPPPLHTTNLMPYTLTELQQLNYDVIMYILRNSCHYNLIKNFVWKLCSIGKQVQGLHLKRVEHFRATL